jgi:hypothetical protein
MDGIRSWLATLVALTALAAPAAEPRLDAGRMRMPLTAPRPLAQPPGRAMFDMHFAESCIAVAELPFQRTCTHVPLDDRDDPSPWPDVFVALEGERIVAAIVPGASWVPRTWACMRLPHFRGPRLCTPPDVMRATRHEWAQRWSTVLRSAG